LASPNKPKPFPIMKNLVNFIAVAATVALSTLMPLGANAQGSAFTYQGQITLNGAPVSGDYVMVFSLYATSAGGVIAAGPLTNAVTITNGLFTATLEFSVGVFNGPNYWLDISVATNGANSFTELSPRQPITPSPYAIFAPNARSASNVTGSVTLSQLPTSVLTNNNTNVNLTGVFNGNGAGLTNLPAASLTGTISNSLLSPDVVTVPAQYPITNVYQTAGVTAVVVPPGAATMTARLWGAGGGGAGYGAGGGGAFVQSTISVTPGQTFVVVVGQHGDYNDNNAGGSGSGDAQGGNGVGSGNGGQGGQASSLFNLTSGNYIMEAVAGGGGGAYYAAPGGAGGNPGQSGGVYDNGTGAPTGGYDGTGGMRGTTDNNGNPGTNYAANATNIGLASLSAAGGSGGAAYASGDAGGGGGGYGGGGGGASYDGGAGGGSYGQTIIAGNGAIPGGTNYPNYLSSNGNGGTGEINGQDGLVVLIFGAGVTIPATVTATGYIGNGSGLTNLTASAITGVIPQSNLGATNSFKPTIGNGTANFTMTTQSGYYALNGNLVYFEIWINWSSLNSVSSGALAISLPPYTVASTRAVFNLGYTGGITNTGVQMVPIASAGATNIALWCIPASGNGVDAVPVSNCASSGQIQITGTYRWQ
jgi:hypothetical protein